MTWLGACRKMGTAAVVCWSMAGSPALAAVDTPSVRGARIANGWAAVGVVTDIASAVVSLDVYDTPKETTENQTLAGFTHALGRTAGLCGAYRSSQHLTLLGEPVSRAPVFAAAATTGMAAMIALGTQDRPRSQTDQVTLVVIRGTAASLVAVQVGLNRKAARVLDPSPRQQRTQFQFSFGPDRVALEGVF